MSLLSKKCIPCEVGGIPLSETQAKELLAQLPQGWSLIGETGIRKEFHFKSFKDAISFVNRVALLADEEGHHPDIFVKYDIVTIELSTHSIKGLSENDFILAAKIEKVVML